MIIAEGEEEGGKEERFVGVRRMDGMGWMAE
jgi:hypothetical protein